MQLIESDTLLFPRTGCDELLGQMFNLGIESHGDRNDAGELTCPRTMALRF